MNPAKTPEPIETPFGLRTRVGPGNHALDVYRSPLGRVSFEGEGHPIVKYRDTAVICAKMAEPIEMLFGLWAWMGPRIS